MVKESSSLGVVQQTSSARLEANRIDYRKLVPASKLPIGIVEAYHRCRASCGADADHRVFDVRHGTSIGHA